MTKLPAKTGATSSALSTGLTNDWLATRLSEADCALNAPLLPAETCRSIIAAYSDETPPSADEASKLVRRLVGSFRTADLADPDIFATALAALFARHPAQDGRAIVSVSEGLPATSKFFPTMSEVNAALAKQAMRRAQLVRNARWMLEERDRREGRVKPSAERRAELVAKLNPGFQPIGAFLKQEQAA